MRRGALITTLALASLAGASAGPAAAAEMPGCADPDVQGGEWRTFGADYSNTRTQPRERTISPGDAPLLTPAWSFSTKEAGAEGDFTGTPVVADGCVYTATNRGWVLAVNADTGKLVWKAKFPQGGTANNSVGVTDRACGKVVKYKKKVVKRRVRGKIRRRVKRVRVAKTKYCPTVFVGATRTRGSLSGETDVDEVADCPAGQKCVGPYAFALDQATGKLAWLTTPLDEQKGSDLFGSPVVFGGVVMFGTSGGAAELGDEADRFAFQGSMSFIDAGTGRILKKTYTIHPPTQPEDEFAGAGIWSTPAVDPEAKVAFVGTANPFKPQAEHKHANAVLRFDIDRGSKRFGEITGSYKGDLDEYAPGFSQLPCYDFENNNPPYYPQGLGSCGDIDLDFGASPNIFKGPNGEKLVGAGQKSGVYHVFDAKTMERKWTQVVGPPTALGGIVGSTAHDGDAVYGPITIPGYAWSVASDDGTHRWVSPIGDGLHWGPPVAVANGVVYSLDTGGFLNAFDARTGAILAKRHLSMGGTKEPTSMSWGGVAVARNTVYANTGLGSQANGFIVAYRPGAPQDIPEDAQESLSGGGGGGDDGGGGGGEGGAAAGGAVVAVPGSTYSTYATPVMVTQPGGPLNFMNFDLPQHDVVADDKGPDGRPLFQSKLSGLGEIAPIEGLDQVKSGSTYAFYCSLHPGMRGNLVVR